MGKTLGNHSSWLHESEKGEIFTAPSMCEPVHNLSIEEILRDYTRGIVHSTRQAFYDEGDDIDEVDPLEDLTDIIEPSQFNDSSQEEQPSEPDLPESAPMEDDSSPSEQ